MMSTTISGQNPGAPISPMVVRTDSMGEPEHVISSGPALGLINP